MGKLEKWLHFMLITPVVLALFVMPALTVQADGVTAPTLSNLEPLSKSDKGSYWTVTFEIKVDNVPNATSVSRFTAQAYKPDETEIPNSSYEDKSFATGASTTGGSIVYEFTMEIHRQDLDGVNVEACAWQGNEKGCTDGYYTFCIPSYTFSGGLDFTNGNSPGDEGTFTSTVWTLTVDACEGRTITVDTDKALLTQDMTGGPDYTIPTDWKACDSGNGIVDTGWQSVSDGGNQTEIDIPQDWEGAIDFQLRMHRNGYGDHAGTYHTSLDVDTSS